MATDRHDDWLRRALGAQSERICHEAVVALAEAHAEATAAQEHQGSKANDTYGHTLKVRSHELLNHRLKEVPGIVLRLPSGVRSRFKYPVIEQTLTVIVPLRFSNDPRVRHENVGRIGLSDLRRALLTGPKPPEEPTLFEALASEDYLQQYENDMEDYEQLVSAGRTIVIGYGSTPNGIFEAGIAEVAIDDEERGTISWRRWRRLPVYTDLGAVPAAPALSPVDDPVRAPERFDVGAPADDDLGLRTRPIPESVPDAEARREESGEIRKGSPA